MLKFFNKYKLDKQSAQIYYQFLQFHKGININFKNNECLNKKNYIILFD